MKLHIRSIRTLLCAALIAGVATIGCSNEDTTAPIEKRAPEFAVPVQSGSISSGLKGLGGNGQQQIEDDIVKFVEGDLVPDATASKLISATGGVLLAGPYQIWVPPGAVAEPTNFELRYFEDGLTMFELLPHGVEFDVPVTIVVNLDGTTLDKARDVTLYWYDDGAEDWVDVGGIWMRRSNLLIGTTTHFSKWGSGRAGW